MRLVVIVSGDYGELGAALYFLLRLPAQMRPLLLLPTTLSNQVGHLPDADVRSYDGPTQLLREIDAAQPDTVLMCSGYLLAVNAGLSLFDVCRLLWRLRARGVRLLTSDPFLGLLRGPGSLDFRDVIDRQLIGGTRWLGWRFAFRLLSMSRLLRGTWHIYPAPIERLPAGGEGSRRLAYFNAAEPVSDHARANGAAAGAPSWLFVLSKVDCELQLRRHGQGFAAQLALRLADGAVQGRRSVLIAPQSLVAAVRPLLAAGSAAEGHAPGSIELRSLSAYDDFMAALMAAEYVFFWNYYSFSVLHRVIAHRPVFFFDEGHMVRILPAIGRAGVELFYGGWRPPLVSFDESLLQQDLPPRAAEAVQQFRRIADALQAGFSPQEVLQRVNASP